MHNYNASYANYMLHVPNNNQCNTWTSPYICTIHSIVFVLFFFFFFCPHQCNNQMHHILVVQSFVVVITCTVTLFSFTHFRYCFLQTFAMGVNAPARTVRFYLFLLTFVCIFRPFMREKLVGTTHQLISSVSLCGTWKANTCFSLIKEKHGLACALSVNIQVHFLLSYTHSVVGLPKA